jgi:hypothetical protein
MCGSTRPAVPHEIPIFRALREVLVTAKAEKERQILLRLAGGSGLLIGTLDRLSWPYTRLLTQELPDT